VNKYEIYTQIMNNAKFLKIETDIALHIGLESHHGNAALAFGKTLNWHPSL